MYINASNIDQINKMKRVLIFLLFIVSNVAQADLLLNGRYEYKTDIEGSDMLGDNICFYPDAISAKRLPRPKTDQRLAWFCFSNTVYAKKLLGLDLQKNGDCGASGTATVRVKNYQVYVEESDGFDTAKLVNVKNIANVKKHCATPKQPAIQGNLPTFKQGEPYASIRNKMLQAGWQPFHSPDADACYKEDERCQGRPEMESCTGTGLGNCRFLWIRNGEKTGICTIGDDAVFDMVCK